MKSAAKERREDIMAFSKEHRRIAELKNIERHHGFMDVDGARMKRPGKMRKTFLVPLEMLSPG